MKNYTTTLHVRGFEWKIRVDGNVGRVTRPDNFYHQSALMDKKIRIPDSVFERATCMVSFMLLRDTIERDVRRYLTEYIGREIMREYNTAKLNKKRKESRAKAPSRAVSRSRQLPSSFGEPTQ